MLNASMPSYLGALSDPLRAMLLWFAALNQDPPRELCRLLGLTELDLAGVERAYAPTLEKLRQLRTVAELCQSQDFGFLLLARIQEMTLCATSPEQVQRLCQAAARLPLWIRDPGLDALERELRHEECAVRMLELRARRSAAAPAAVPESVAGRRAGSARHSLASGSPISSAASPSSSAAPSARPTAADTGVLDLSAASETGPNESKTAKSQEISAAKVKSAPSRGRTAGMRKPSRAARKAANTGRVTSGRP